MKILLLKGGVVYIKKFLEEFLLLYKRGSLINNLRNNIIYLFIIYIGGLKDKVFGYIKIKVNIVIRVLLCCYISLSIYLSIYL